MPAAAESSSARYDCPASRQKKEKQENDKHMTEMSYAILLLNAKNKEFIIIIVTISYFLKSFRENKYVDAAFYGLRPASTGLIASAGMTVVLITLLQLDLFKNTNYIMDLFNWKSLILAVIIYLLTNNINQTKKLHPVFFIAGSAIIGIIFGFAGV